MEMSFKRGQTCHDKERSEIAKERYLASGQNRIDTGSGSLLVKDEVKARGGNLGHSGGQRRGILLTRKTALTRHES